MRARRAGEKGVLYVEPDQDELDRRQEKRTMSYEERHQTDPISLNTMYGHLKKGPCKQTGFKPRVIVYETSSEEEVEQQKPDENNWTALVEKEPKIEAKAPEELKEIPVIQKTDKNRDKELPELTKKIPKDSLSTSKPDEAHSVINTESPKSVAEAKEPEIKLSQQPTSPGTDKIKDPKTKSSSEAASFQSKSDDANSIIKTESPKPAVSESHKIISSQQKAVPIPKKILEPQKILSSEAISLHSKSDQQKEKLINETAVLKSDFKINKTTEKPDILNLKKKQNLEENLSKPEITPVPESLSRTEFNQKHSLPVKLDVNENSISESSSKLKVAETYQKAVKEPSSNTSEISELPPDVKLPEINDASPVHDSSDRKPTAVDSIQPVKNKIVTDMKIELPQERVLPNLDEDASLKDLPGPADSIDEKHDKPTSLLIGNENSIAQDLKKLAENSLSQGETVAPKKSKKKKEIVLPKEEDYSDFEDDFQFGFKDFDLVYYWTWDVANETCAICRNNLMDMDVSLMSFILLYRSQDTSRTLIVWGECGHAFHNNCMVQWTKNNPRCPLCQADWAISRIGQ